MVQDSAGLSRLFNFYLTKSFSFLVGQMLPDFSFLFKKIIYLRKMFISRHFNITRAQR